MGVVVVVGMAVVVGVVMEMGMLMTMLGMWVGTWGKTKEEEIEEATRFCC